MCPNFTEVSSNNYRSTLYYQFLTTPTSLSSAIHAQEHAKTKKIVSNVLALNLVTQLYKMGAIEAARAPGTKKPADEVRFITIVGTDCLNFLLLIFSFIADLYDYVFLEPHSCMYSFFSAIPIILLLYIRVP